MHERYRSGNGLSIPLLPERITTTRRRALRLASMVTRIRKGTPPRLYMKENREAKGLSVAEVAGRIESEDYPDGVSRETVWRWEVEQWRLNPEKIAAYANALGLEDWTALARMPNTHSLDAIVKDASPDVRDMAADIVRRLVANQR